MTLPLILGPIIAGTISFIMVIYFATQVEKYARRKWMQASAHQIILLSGLIIAMFSVLLLAAIIRIGLIIGGIL